MFALGDVADSGAPKAARPALEQAKVVAQNVARLLAGQGSDSFDVRSFPPFFPREDLLIPVPAHG